MMKKAVPEQESNKKQDIIKCRTEYFSVGGNDEVHTIYNVGGRWGTGAQGV